MLKEIKHCLYVDLSDKNFFGNRRSKVYNYKTTQEQSGDRESSS